MTDPLFDHASKYVCLCSSPHDRKRVVVTGGPGAGKTALLELCKQYFCSHVLVLPESASLLFSGGFPRRGRPAERAATQRAIFNVQTELETVADCHDNAAIVLCDRGTVDGAAYWPGPGTLFEAVGTTHEAQLARYSAVIHLRTPDPRHYSRENPLRIESAIEAANIDEGIELAWRNHPRRIVIESTTEFLDKARAALAALRAELPECCLSRLGPTLP
jgi:predicted ATPase